MRTVTVISTQGDNKVEINTSATNWGQLKADINKDGRINASEAKAMIKGTRTPLNNDYDGIPEGDFGVFITPSKIKSGK